MLIAPEAPNEEERLNTLRRLRIMDTATEEAWDRLTQLASKLCKTPISLVSLVGEKRQWFKSRVGLEAQETPKEYAFCAHAILENDPFVVPDTHRDQRFLDNPLVTGDPNIRFYAGAPISAPDGTKMGTICVIDREPRDLDEFQLEGLRVIAEMANQLLTTRAGAIVLQDALESLALEALDETSPEGRSLRSRSLREAVESIQNHLRHLQEDWDLPEEFAADLDELHLHARRIENAAEQLMDDALAGKGR